MTDNGTFSAPTTSTIGNQPLISIPIKIVEQREQDEQCSLSPSLLAAATSTSTPVIVRDSSFCATVAQFSDSANKTRLKSLLTNVDVVVHVTLDKQMSFIDKNFKYKSLKLHDLIDRCDRESQTDFILAQNELYYLRSLSTNDQRKEPASVARDFPDFWSQISVLADLIPAEQIFSSVLRMSSPGIQMWTHYDVMDNLLFQVVGSKRVDLFPPTDVPYLYLKGDKSQVLDIDCVDSTRYPEFRQATRHTAVMQPGDILYIPAFWFHNTRAESMCVNVNVFWRELSDQNLYDAKDVYANRDLMPAQRAQQGVQKAMQQLKVLPDEYRRFYTLRLIQQLTESL